MATRSAGAPTSCWPRRTCWALLDRLAALLGRFLLILRAVGDLLDRVQALLLGRRLDPTDVAGLGGLAGLGGRLARVLVGDRPGLLEALVDRVAHLLVHCRVVRGAARVAAAARAERGHGEQACEQAVAPLSHPILRFLGGVQCHVAGGELRRAAAGVARPCGGLHRGLALLREQLPSGLRHRDLHERGLARTDRELQLAEPHGLVPHALAEGQRAVAVLEHRNAVWTADLDSRQATAYRGLGGEDPDAGEPERPGPQGSVDAARGAVRVRDEEAVVVDRVGREAAKRGQPHDARVRRPGARGRALRAVRGRAAEAEEVGGAYPAG